LNRGEEDYIKALLKLNLKNKSEVFISNQELVSYFNHTPQTVNEMVKKLVKKNYISYVPYKGTRLTEEGKLIASNLIRKHRLWECFLVDILHYNWDEVHEEAEDLEHLISDKFYDRLNQFLEEPKKCPHGRLIPDKETILTRVSYLNLLDAKENHAYRIVRVTDDKDLLEWLNDFQITINTGIHIISIDPISKHIILKHGQEESTIDFRLANKIDVIDVD